MKLRSKLIGVVVLAASAIALGVVSTPAQAISLPSDPPFFTFPKQPRPDLAVSSIATTWTRFTVANVGNAPAGPFTVAVGPRYGDCSHAFFLLPPIWTSVRVNGLAAGAFVQLDVGPSQWARYIAVDINREVLEHGESSDGTRTLDLGNNFAVLPGEFYPCPT